jgi:hypothetical protein
MPSTGRAKAPEPAVEIPDLRSLGPAYDERRHGRNAAVLVKALRDESPNAAKNIAVAGHYGSGKSSVILGVQAKLDKFDVKWVNLSLSSLGVDDTRRARIQEDGTLPPLTNLIQKEIVKQLLYRKAPADMPGSRYFRIDSFRAAPAALWASAVAIGFFVVAVLLGLVRRVDEVAPKDVADGPAWAPWLVVALLAALVGAVFFLGLRSLQNRIRVDSVSAGGAAVSLSKKENSFFDEYLDEIVYFFQRTKTRVAIFEDLDRFRDPHIFETLRELNTVLNNSEQVKARPVRFVYAVRDSIFEQLEVDAGAAEEETGEAVTRASALESAPPSNRTKFFDLVVPMVPFITHRSARDLLEAEFADAAVRPSPALINLVGGRLTDMRLIHNIRNEFEIYRASVLGDEGLKGLTADRLFAMMVYKNTHLEDFENIRLGKSRIDQAHRAFSKMVEYQAAHQSARSKAALTQAKSAALWDRRAKAAGERLQAVLPILHRMRGGDGSPVVTYQSETYDLSSLGSAPLWRSLFRTREAVLLGQRGYGAVNISFDELVTVVGAEAAGMDDAVDEDAERLREQSRCALETKEFVRRATMAELMARTDLRMATDDDVERNLDEIVAGLVSPLARELLAKGYLDENFTLYCSDFYGVAISLSAMNFILHSVQKDRPMPRFRFDEASSIEAVEKETGSRFLEGESVYNIEVFDHYLTEHPDRLAPALDKLAARATADPSFLDAYLTDGTAKERFVRELAARWPGLFVHVVENAPLATEPAVELVDAAVRNSVRDVRYESSDRVAEFIAEHYAQMDAFTQQVDTDKAADLASLLRRLGAELPDLAQLGEEQRRAVVIAGLYPVTRGNLLAALGDGAGLALDVLKAHDQNVYARSLARPDDYLEALSDEDVTVDDPDAFVDVLTDVLKATERIVLPVAQRASEGCQVADLAELPPSSWPAVVSARRFRATASNVSKFVNEHGVTSDLATALSTRDLVDVEELEEEARLQLAYALVEADSPTSNIRVRLVSQLHLPNGLEPERMSGDSLVMLPALLAAGLVPDDEDTYATVSDRPFEFRETYFAASKALASYVTSLPLSADDLAGVMRSGRVAADVKRAIADDADFVADRLSRPGAIAICQWASRGQEVSVDLLVALSNAGAPADYVLPLLEPHLRSIELHVLDEILGALGEEYEPLTRTGRHRPRLNRRDGTTALLDELKRRDRVSSFSDAMMGGIRVHMRQ